MLTRGGRDQTGHPFDHSPSARGSLATRGTPTLTAIILRHVINIPTAENGKYAEKLCAFFFFFFWAIKFRD